MIQHLPCCITNLAGMRAFEILSKTKVIFTIEIEGVAAVRRL